MGWRIGLRSTATSSFAEIAPWRAVAARRRAALQRLKASLLLLEQPIARARALAEPVHALGNEIPMEIDESDADVGVFPRARALGYRGISSKSCKGFYRALINRARVLQWNTAEGAAHYFMSAEDLTTQAGVAVQQDLALQASSAPHRLRNGHHTSTAGRRAAGQQALFSPASHLYVLRRTDARAGDPRRHDRARSARYPGLALR